MSDEAFYLGAVRRQLDMYILSKLGWVNKINYELNDSGYPVVIDIDGETLTVKISRYFSTSPLLSSFVQASIDNEAQKRMNR